MNGIILIFAVLISTGNGNLETKSIPYNKPIADVITCKNIAESAIQSLKDNEQVVGIAYACVDSALAKTNKPKGDTF